jgi:sugar lactone lactonase YvrE
MGSEGLIWLGLKAKGLVAYNPISEQFKSFPFNDDTTVDWSTISVRSIFEDSRNWLWIGTYGGGAIVLNKERQVIHHFCTYDTDGKTKQLSNDFVFDFEEDENGNIYIATAGKGINIFTVETNRVHFIHANDQRDMNSYGKTICMDDSNTLWIGTEGNGLYTFDTKNQTWAIYRNNTSKNSISSDIITDIQLDRHGKLWLATDGGGLNKYDQKSKSFQHFRYNSTQSKTLNTDALYDLFFDKSENLWIGTFNGGVNVLKAIHPPFYTKRKYHAEKELGLRSVLTVREDKNRRVWLGTDGGGLFYFDLDKEYLELKNAAGLLIKGQFNDVITCIHPQKNQGLWYGSFANGLHFFDAQRGVIKQFMHDDDNPNSLIHNNVWDL